ncbi:MAG: hypothetical protein ACM3MG_03500 [Bacillota bacterium]
MFSKGIKVLSALMASVLLLSGCDTKLWENPPEVEAQQYVGAACLSNTGPVLNHYIAGTATDVEIKSLWDCLGAAVSSFQRYVRGSDKNRYTSQEIATFLEQNFLDQKEQTVITPALQLEFMKLKQLFVGGDRNYITQTELDRTRDVFQLLKTITLRLNPYMKVLLLKWKVSGAKDVQNDLAFFEAANVELQNSARTLADHIEKNGQTYNLSDFVTFLKQLSAVLDQDWAMNQTIETYMPVVKKVKKALAGGNENSVAPTEWRRFSLLGARGFVQYLRYYYFIESVPENGGGYRLTYLARSVEDILSVFQDLVGQKPEGIVSRDEVNDILLTLSKVWPEFKMSSGLIYQSMKIKQVFFGGSLDSFTTQDFNNARQKVSRLKTLIERFLPFYSIYSSDWDPSLYPSEEAQKMFMDSQDVLEATGRELGVLFEGSYDLKDLVSLAKEFETLYPPKKAKDSIVPQINKFLPLVIDTKNIVLGGKDSSVSKSSWSVLLGLGSRVYSDYLYYNYFLKTKTLESSRTVGYLSVLSNQTLDIVGDILDTKRVHQLSLDEMSVIMRRLLEADLLPEGMTMSSLKNVLKLLVNNIMVSPEDRLSGSVPNAINKKSVEVVRRELQVWLDMEMFVAKLSRNWREKEGLRPRDMMDVIEKAQDSSSSSSYLKEGLKEMMFSLKTPSPLTIDGEGRLYISRRLQQVYDHDSLSQLNLDRAVARLLLRSFAGDLSRIRSYAGVTLDEVNFVFNQVRPLVLEMKLLDPENKTFGEARFRDANIFMAHSDGNNLASFVEVTDLIGMIWSGIGINTMVTKDLSRDCMGGKSKVNSNDKVSVDCAVRSYRASLTKYMTATPEYVQYMKSVNADVSSGYVYNLFKSSGYIPNDSRQARIVELGQVPFTVQYIEMLMARFDEDGDGYLNAPEALKAFDLFEGLLKQFAGDQVKEKDLPAVFMFLLRYGKAPTTVREKLTFVLRWRGKPENWKVAADRTQLAAILGYIADMSNKTAPAVVEIPESELVPEQ